MGDACTNAVMSKKVAKIRKRSRDECMKAVMSGRSDKYQKEK